MAGDEVGARAGADDRRDSAPSASPLVATEAAADPRAPCASDFETCQNGATGKPDRPRRVCTRQRLPRGASPSGVVRPRLFAHRDRAGAREP